jgi:hypothetical protein
MEPDPRENIVRFVKLFCLQFVALLPMLFKRQLQQYEERKELQRRR